MKRLLVNDAYQQAFEFMVAQGTHFEAQTYKKQYPEIQYPRLIPLDFSADEWAPSITYFSVDQVGAADWFSHLATDMNLADVNRQKFEAPIYMAGIGYRYSLEEIMRAQRLNIQLTSDRSDAARRASEIFIDRRAFVGDTPKGWTGLLNNASATRVDATADGTSSSRLWSAKTADQIVRDINAALTGIFTGSNTVETADTVLLPQEAYAALATQRVDTTTIMAWDLLMKNNIYTMRTGLPLTVLGVLGLETAADTGGTSGTGRMVVYKRDPDVLKMHIPMRFRFLTAWQTSPLGFDVPGIFRIGQLEIRRPKAVRYVDGITAAP